jgi:hypothetical protein
MVLAEGVRSAVAGLRFAAPNVAALGAEPEVEGAPALLAPIAAWRRDQVRGVGAGARRRQGVLGLERGCGIHARPA